MSTTNIKNIISRYVTGCGTNITVFQFPDSDPRQMEQKFKTRFRSYHVELEFFDSNHFFDYLAWCTAYTKASPVVGDGNLKCVSNAPTRTVNIQCDIRRDPPAATDLQLPLSQRIPNVASQQPTDDLTFKRNPVNMSDKTHIVSNKFTTIDDIRVKCNSCDKILTRIKFKRHKTICKGVPKNTCIYCKKLFTCQQNHSRHKKTCKLNPVNMKINVPPPPTNVTTGPPTHIVNNYYVDNSIHNSNVGNKQCYI